ncbi:Vegetative incompatibility protein HET-E-1 [Gracilariopsis chorda]|uniref:Vegetative incompatibility protein HET-E-1 n=1 Tax=Gracilariopsis chorda TaxID=448386 RepID=A0A2V3IKW8_9FLOR|nr:Vegetative incompatibility protein HET-E-1 [Gracilariopsis chorda]|eukprot:PXF42703.1 Vegetative incompatibility protein HET-E-1 [Gracilariopsis chorda]
MGEAAVAGVSKGADKLESYFKKCFERRDLVADNKTMLRDLLHEYENTLKDINEAENSRLHDIDSVDNTIHRRLGEFKERLEARLEDLRSRTEQVEEANWMSRVKRMRRVMEECQALVTEAREYYETSVRPALERTEDVDSGRDRYIVGSNVPPNPPRLTLDYSSTVTCEGSLKAEILSCVQSSSRIVGVMASGLGGVGKTCALRGLADEKGIQDVFPDGILFIQLGNDSVLPDIIKGIAECVKQTGGRRLCRTIQGAKTVEEACDEARQWFEGRKCLFLVDDIWEVNGITPYELRKLGRMLNKKSLLVFTSRSKGFMEGVDKNVLFKEREDEELAQRMLMNHASIGNYTDLNSSNREAVKGILEICQGLPLALGIAGATVRSYCGSDMNDQDAWSNYYHDLKSKAKSIASGSTKLYGPLRRIVDRSLEVLDLESRFEKTFEDMFQGFCVLQRQQSVRGSMLQKLWNVDDLGGAVEIAELFESVSLIRMMRKKENEFSIQVHDLVLEIANEMASGSRKTEWLKTLLKNYIPKERTASTETEIEATSEGRGMFTPWWEVEDDGFIHDNVCRVLHAAGETKEVVWLLERAQWMVMRLQKSGISGVEQDLAIGIQVAKGSGDEEAELVRYLRLIGSAARMSFIHVVENAYEAWFQMYGRVIWHARQCERTRRFACEVEECAPRPWVKPSVGVLNEAGGPMTESFRTDDFSSILDLCHCGDVIRVLWVPLYRSLFVTEYNRIHGNRKTYELGSAVTESKLYGGRGSSGRNNVLPWSRGCRCGAFSGNLKNLVSGHDDGRVVVWDIDSGYKVDHSVECPASILRRIFQWVCVILGGYGANYATCAAISGDGRTVVFGSKHGRVYIWDIHNHEAAGHPFEIMTVYKQVRGFDVSFDGKRILCRINSSTTPIYAWDRDIGGEIAVPAEMQKDDVTCVAISRDGGRVVSGSEDGTIRMWNMNSTGGSVQTMRGHTRILKYVAFSANGRRFISAATDKTVCVWDAEKCVMITQPLELEGGGRAAVSADGNEVVTSRYNTIRVFKMQNADTADGPGRYTGRVNCVAYCGRGSKVVSGCTDGCVRLWDAESGDRIGQPLAAHTDAVECVAVSADANRIVSASRDGTVRVWDANSGEAVAEHLAGVGCFGYEAVNDDGTRVVFSFEKRVDVWDVDSGRVTTVTRDAQIFTCVAMSSDGARIAFCPSYHSVVVWDVRARQRVRSPLDGHTDKVRLAFSGDGTRLVSGSDDRTVRVWDVASGEAIGHPFVHDCRVVHVQSDVGGATVASYDIRGHGRLWDVKLGKCVMTSSDPKWTSTLHRLGVARLQWLFWEDAVTENVASTSAEQQQVLESIYGEDRAVVPVGDVYFSRKHGSSFWPFCKLVK